MPVLIGTSGWQYASWKETFYPRDVPQRLWLEYYAARFQTVELNVTFYRLPAPTTFAKWPERVPADFVMVVKMSRYLTHVRRLRDPEEPVRRFMERVRLLGTKLGPVLVQLPPQLPADLVALDEVLRQFPAGVRIAFEARHPSWYSDETASLLAEHDAAWCLADSPKRTTPEWRTASWGYVRFHEGQGDPHPCYTRDAIRAWAERLAQQWKPDEELFVFFNNDPRACAPRDAQVFAEEIERVGLVPTRVPAPGEVRIAA